MTKTALIRARKLHNLKDEVERIFKDLGLTTSYTINLFYS